MIPVLIPRIRIRHTAGTYSLKCYIVLSFVTRTGIDQSIVLILFLLTLIAPLVPVHFNVLVPVYAQLIIVRNYRIPYFC